MNLYLLCCCSKSTLFTAVSLSSAEASLCCKETGVPRALAVSRLLLFGGGGVGYPAGASAEEGDALLIRTPVDINDSLLGRVEASLFH